MANTTFSSFFYGTLMHPRILKRVIGSDASHLQIAPAILFEHTRHKVKFVDYPGVVPYESGRLLFDRELAEEERCVRGTLVTGLTAQDIAFLDVFEGAEYDRRNIRVHPLQPLFELSQYTVGSDDASIVPANPPPLPPQSELLPALDAQTYIYHELSNLSAELWSFDDFVKKNAWKWYGAAADNNEDITEVDRRRALQTSSSVEGNPVAVAA